MNTKDLLGPENAPIALETLAYEIQGTLLNHGVPCIQSWDYGEFGYRITPSQYDKCMRFIQNWKLVRAKWHVVFDYRRVSLDTLQRLKETNFIQPLIIFRYPEPYITAKERQRLKTDMRLAVKRANELTIQYHRW